MFGNNCSLAVSVKMSILLFAPGFLALLLVAGGWRETLVNLSICIFTQVPVYAI